jgi:DNA-binding transcriptional regulator YbjK
VSSLREEQILDAAISVLGQRGVRQLTHRAVDAAAGVPAGSTSNYFRTRDALIDATVERFLARERATWDQIATTVNPTSPDQLAAALAWFVMEATGAQQALTVARFALLIEAALHPRLQPRVRRAGEAVRTLAAQWLRAVGSAQPVRDARIILDHADGLMLHQLAFPEPIFDPTDELAVLVTAVLGAG